MLVKVCGMRDERNAQEVGALGISMMGFIFHPSSPRYVGDVAPATDANIVRVGVFVNSDLEHILMLATRNNLDAIQLHGTESVELCQALRNEGYRVFKAISVAAEADLAACDEYASQVDMFIFDTKCSGYGGSGMRFDWSLLDAYTLDTPFLLSGGIDADMSNEVNSLTHPMLYGVDLNSRFESAPALKRVDALKYFIEKLKKRNTMNRIESLFARKNSDILSVYYPAGFPNLDDTLPILEELERQGVDMVELGIPFSDPMADGVVIQAAATKALSNGITLRKIFEQISDMRTKVTIPVILMGYLNPIMHFGFEAFFETCQQCGVDGVIIPDLPFNEYINEIKSIAEQYDVRVIMFISPETSEERVRLIDESASGFIYMVSSAGTTGARSSFGGDDYFTRINAMGLRHPRLIGFGISNGETYKAACAASNGAIVGSHFVKLLESEATIKEAVEKLLQTLK